MTDHEQNEQNDQHGQHGQHGQYEQPIASPSPQPLPQHPQPIFQMPEWETITHPPKPRQSFLGRLFPSSSFAADSLGTTSGPRSTATDSRLFTKDTSDQSSTLPTHNPPALTTTRTPTGEAEGPKPPLLARLRRRLDAAFPPHRTYLGRPRRFLFLAVLLPLALLLFVLAPLAIGLGVGLSRRHRHYQNLPLPGDKSVFTGALTYYEPALGACGTLSDAGQDIVAVSHLVFDAAGAEGGGGGNPNENPLCGMKIRVERDFVEDGAGNRSVDVTVVDRCVACAATDLDLSLAVFAQLAPQDSGRVVGSWAWLS
ncbi:hypothetical protein F5B20DRAFT_547616 [Whalleya microplaca]|nr:hypothetical protein F5B20DRAFT_547616 [Whalleya microplaca]